MNVHWVQMRIGLGLLAVGLMAFAFGADPAKAPAEAKPSPELPPLPPDPSTVKRTRPEGTLLRRQLPAPVGVPGPTTPSNSAAVGTAVAPPALPIIPGLGP